MANMKVLIGFCIVAVALAARPEVKKTCTEKPETGMCMALFRMWYYDPDTQSCQKFIYGGCQGNGNRYWSEEECMKNCKDSNDVLEAIPMPFSCDCESGNSICACCGHLKVTKIRLDRKVCVEVGYDDQKVALQVNIKANEKIVFNSSISATNPPPVCVGMPPMTMFADVCFDFYDIKVTLDKIYFCLNVKPRLLRKEVGDMKVGCFDFNRGTAPESL